MEKIEITNVRILEIEGVERSPRSVNRDPDLVPLND